jgi:hypothetical protein
MGKKYYSFFKKDCRTCPTRKENLKKSSNNNQKSDNSQLPLIETKQLPELPLLKDLIKSREQLSNNKQKKENLSQPNNKQISLFDFFNQE